MDAASVIQRAVDFALRQFPSMDDMVGLTGVDVSDGHYYKGLGFNPVGANPKAMNGLEERTAQQAQTLSDVASLIKLLGDPDPSTWEGEGAKAFVDRVKVLPPEYADAAAALRALGPLVTEARQAITAGKTRAKELDDQAWQARTRIMHEVAEAAKPKGLLDTVVSTVVPVASIIGIALDPGVARAVHHFVDLLEQGVKLHFSTKVQLDHIGQRISKLDDKVPEQKKSGVASIPGVGSLTDLLADGSDLLDAGMNPLAKWMIDRFPAEAHWIAQEMGDVSTILGMVGLFADGTIVGLPVGLVLGAGSVLLSGGQIAIDQRIYRTGAVDATGKPVLTQDEMAQEYGEFALGLVTMGTGKFAGKAFGPAGEVLNEFIGPTVDKGDEVRPGDPKTYRPKIILVDPTLDYAEDKGWTGGDEKVPELRVRRDPALCYPPDSGSGSTGPTTPPPNVVPLPPATGQPNIDGNPYTGPPGGYPQPLANTA
ncbi:MAG TPA: hypothetical protein VMU51_36785 [Mycobacteriales bacterium]|nr:hypothetical protein [Mycobacteriales bacterium]